MTHVRPDYRPDTRQIMAHKWFADIDWAEIADGSYQRESSDVSQSLLRH